MAGLSLIHIGFLAAGLAVAVPIIIHLLFRQKTRTLAIGSVQFLHQVVREHRRRRRVRQWLLLALRMLAVLLLALLFARPYHDESTRQGMQQEVVLLLDRSASMQANDGGGKTAFDRARDDARAELKKFDENVVVHVAVCDATGILELPIDQLAKVSPGEAATDYNLALGWAGDVLAASKRSNRRVILICDLQKTGLHRAQRTTLPEGVDLIVHDVGEALARNVAVESALPGSTEIRPDGKIALRVVIRNFGALVVKQANVHCELTGPDGPIKISQTVDISAQGNAVLDIPLPIKTDGLYQGFVELQIDDVLPLDNRRWVAFEARHPDRVLLVDGQEGRSVFTNETYFLETALRLRTDEVTGTERSFEPERIAWESGTGFPRLDGYRAIVLANVRRLSEDDGKRLEEYLRGGGGLLIFAGDQVSRASLASLAQRHLLPGTIAAEPVNGKLLVDEWDHQHSALSCFADPQRGDMRRVGFTRVLPLRAIADGARVLLKSGDQVIAAESAIGKGRCIYFGSTADRDWTDLPRTRMYVPVMRQLLAYLTDQLGNRAAVSNRFVTQAGDKIGIAPRPEEPGRWIVTNLDPRESSLNRVTPEELQIALGGGSETAEDEAQQAALRLFLPTDSLRPDEFWTTVAWLLLLILAAETLLASRVHA
jgi:hypothetical protein